jgi:hypothetical protein
MALLAGKSAETAGLDSRPLGQNRASQFVPPIPVFRLFHAGCQPPLCVQLPQLGHLPVPEFRPAPVGQRKGVDRPEDEELAARRSDADRRLAQLRPELSPADDDFQLEQMPLAVALDLDNCLRIAARQRPDLGCQTRIQFLDLPVPAGRHVMEPRLRDLLTVHKQPRRVAAPQQNPLRSGRNRRIPRGPQQERTGPIVLDAPRRVLVRHLGKSEVVRLVAGGQPTMLGLPRRLVRNAFEDVDHQRILGNLRQIAFVVGSGIVIPCADPLGGQRRSVDGHFVDPTLERAARRSAHRGADPQIVVIHHRPAIRSAPHVPSARYRFAVDVTPHAVRLAERISHRDMMPSAIDRHRRFRSPTVPVSVSSRTSEQERHARRSAASRQPQRVILIVPRESSVLRPALAHDVRVSPVSHGIGQHPGFQRDAVAQFEIQGATGTRIPHPQIAIAVDLDGLVVRHERRIVVRPRALDAQCDFADDFGSQRIVRTSGHFVPQCCVPVAIEAPVRRRTIGHHRVAMHLEPRRSTAVGIVAAVRQIRTKPQRDKADNRSKIP